jgi:hypothetical protein
VALELAGGDGFEFIMEPRAIQLHVLDPGYGLVTHLSYVPGDYRTVAMLTGVLEKDRRALMGRARRDYEELCSAEYDREKRKKG